MSYTFAFLKQDAYKAWVKKFPADDLTNFAFEFSFTEIENESKEIGAFIQECVDYIERLDAFDDYDAWEMEIDVKPNSSGEIYITIRVTNLVR